MYHRVRIGVYDFCSAEATHPRDVFKFTVSFSDKLRQNNSMKFKPGFTLRLGVYMVQATSECCVLK